jgi:hypothetical protein
VDEPEAQDTLSFIYALDTGFIYAGVLQENEGAVKSPE